MANYYNTASWANTGVDYSTRIGAALVAVGFTLVDSVGSMNGAGTSRRVYQAPDVNGATGVSFFIDIAYISGTFTINACIDYDAVTHTPISEGGPPSFSLVNGVGYIYANPLGFYLVVIDGSSNPNCFVGQPRCLQVQGQTDGLCASTATITAGATTVAVNANLTGRLYVGQVVAIQNFAHDSTSPNKDNRELVTITSVGASSLSFSATANDYDSGAKIGPPDMLYPLGGSSAVFQTYNGEYLNISVQCTNLNQAGTATTTSSRDSAHITGSGIYAGMTSANLAGLPVEAFVLQTMQGEAAGFSSALPLFGLLAAYIGFNGGAPATGAKFTDGTNVFVLPSGGTAVGGSKPSLLVGPTGDTPDFSTMGRFLPTVITISDSIYAVPPSTPAAFPSTNALNQGLN